MKGKPIALVHCGVDESSHALVAATDGQRHAGADQTSSLRAKRRFAFYKRPYVVMRTCLRGLVISTLAELLLSSALETFR